MSTASCRGAGRAYARRSLQFVQPHRRALLGVLGLALLMSTLSAVDPLIMKFLFDQFAGGRNLRLLGAIMAGLLALELMRGWLGGCLGVLSWDVRLAVDYQVREVLIGKLNSLPVAYHQQEGVGGRMNRVNQAINGFVTAFSDIAFNLLPTLLYLTLSVAAMARLDWRLSLVVFVFAPLPALIGARAAPEQTQRERRLVERWTSIYSRFNEVLAGIVTVKSFAMEEVEKHRFLRGVREGNDIVRQGVRTDTRTGVLRTLAGTSARLVAIGFGGVLVWRGEITVGTLVAFLGYIGGLFGPVQNLTNTYQSLRRATISLETIFGILDAEDAVGDDPNAVDLPALRGEVRFEDVRFEYREGSPVLRGIDLHVHPGETIALVGPSGSGKSTLVSLIQRLYVPDRRPGPGGRAGCPLADPEVPAPPDQRRAAGRGPVQRHRARQHRVWPPRRFAGGNRGRRPRRQRTRVHRRPSRGIRHPGARAGNRLVGRATTADCHRARVAHELARGRPRRAYLGPRHRL